ncbi:MAG: RIP metalloprotease RseP [Candidatus Omnitrophica bacterium]|nr:RIP metalloprotease RseP [Candidatus Omnitrophota bacterium]
MSLIAFLFVLSVLVIIHEFGHFIIAKRNGVKVEKFSFGFGPKLFGLTRGDTEYRISLIPLGGYVKMAGDEPESATGHAGEFLSKTVWQRFKIVVFGPVLNYVLAFVLFWVIFMVGSPVVINKIGSLLDDYPAKAAGLLAGDRILSVDGQKTAYWEELTDIIHNKKTGDLNLEVERATKTGQQVIKIKVTPKLKEVTDIFGKKCSISLIGIAPSGEAIKVRYGIVESFLKAGATIYKLTDVTCKSLLFIVTGKLSIKESMTGPIGMYIITGKAAELGMVYLLQMMAILSASLAIFNLLPVPVLDGGHILFLVIEKIRGKPLSAKFQEKAAQGGLALLIALMLFVLYADILRFIVKK